MDVFSSIRPISIVLVDCESIEINYFVPSNRPPPVLIKWTSLSLDYIRVKKKGDAERERYYNIQLELL